MDFFNTKHAKHKSKNSEINSSPCSIHSKLFIYKPNQVKPIIPAHFRNLPVVAKNQKESMTSKDSDSICSPYAIQEYDLLSLNCKINSKSDIQKPSKLLKKPAKLSRKRRNFSTYSRKIELIETKPSKFDKRRHYSSDIRNGRDSTTRVRDVKDYLKVFHKKSKYLLDCLQKNVFGK